jgi:hypothetical protein
MAARPRSSAVSSTSWSAWPRSTASPSSTTPRPPTWTRARKSLEAFDRPVVAILGGRYKGGDFGDLREDLAGAARR